MHEFSLALEVAHLVGKELVRHPGRLTAVHLELGDGAGIEPANLEFCLEAVMAPPPFDGAPVILHRVPGDTLRLDSLEVDDGRPDD